MLQIPASSGRSPSAQRRELKPPCFSSPQKPASDHTVLERCESTSPIYSHEFKSYTECFPPPLLFFRSLPVHGPFLFSRRMYEEIHELFYMIPSPMTALFIYSVSLPLATFTFSLIIRHKLMTTYSEGNVWRRYDVKYELRCPRYVTDYTN